MQKDNGASSPPRQVEYDSISRNGRKWNGSFRGLSDSDIGSLVGAAAVDDRRRYRLVALREWFLSQIERDYPSIATLEAQNRTSGLRDRSLTPVEMDDLAQRLRLLRELDAAILQAASQGALDHAVDNALNTLTSLYRDATGSSDIVTYLDEVAPPPPTASQILSGRRHEHQALREAWVGMHGRAPSDEEDALLSKIAEPLGQIEAEALAAISGVRSHEETAKEERAYKRMLKRKVRASEPAEINEEDLQDLQRRENEPPGVRVPKRKPGPKPKEKPRRQNEFERRQIKLIEHRAQVLRAIQENPGSSGRQLIPLAGLRWPSVVKTLADLENRSLIGAEEGGKYPRYFPIEAVDEKY